MKRTAENTEVSSSGQTTIKLSAKFFTAFCFCLLLLAFSGCNQIQSPKPEPFVGEVAPPRKQEFRWSNGKMPKSFDPALASASPETDIVRAIYEGLTDIDSKTLAPVPAIAAKWSASADFKTWTFQLRQDAKWSNGENVTAQDFVKSWKRLTELGEKVGQRDLLKNIVGMDTKNVLPVFASETPNKLPKTEPKAENKKTGNNESVSEKTESEKTEAQPVKAAEQTAIPQAEPQKKPSLAKNNPQAVAAKFGVEAIDNYTLKITLNQPDKEFPELVAHPIFRPVYGDGKDFESLDAQTVTNGAFKVAELEKNSLVLERSPDYWNKDQVKLERVRFVPTENAENALEAYRAGEIDAITNANLEPLALKLLTPYDDFRRVKHNALNFYEFNLNQEPYADRRVREALAIAIERERLTEGDMDGATEPALSFSPFETDDQLNQDVSKARKLLADAGFADGEDFPAIRLLVNRNNVQQKIARSIAAMWKKNLKIDTEIIIKDQADFDNAVQIGDYDIVRRGIVLPTTDETANMLNMFPANRQIVQPSVENTAKNQILTDKTAESKLDFSKILEEHAQPETEIASAAPIHERALILTEQEALLQLPAIPLYFPTSYSLVKPYVQGFELNELDAVSLKDVQIDSNWQPSGAENKSNGNN